MTDVGDKDQVKGRQKKRRLSREAEVEGLRQLLSHYWGREFVWRTLEQCGVYAMSYQGDVNRHFMSEGKREVGLWLLDEVFTASPNSYNLMRSEAEQRANKDN